MRGAGPRLEVAFYVQTVNEDLCGLPLVRTSVMDLVKAR
jgi:hypothetical protein